MLLPVSYSRMKRLEKSHNFKMLCQFEENNVSISLFQSSINSKKLVIGLCDPDNDIYCTFHYRKPSGVVFPLDMPFLEMRKHFFHSYVSFMLTHPFFDCKPYYN